MTVRELLKELRRIQRNAWRRYERLDKKSELTENDEELGYLWDLKLDEEDIIDKIEDVIEIIEKKYCNKNE